jgi:hypothetical protein
MAWRTCSHHGHDADVGRAIGFGLEAAAEPPGVIAYVHDLDPPGIQVDAPRPQTQQFPAAQAGADLDDEVVAVEGRAADQEPAELLGGIGPAPDPAEHDLGAHRIALGLPYRTTSTDKGAVYRLEAFSPYCGHSKLP